MDFKSLLKKILISACIIRPTVVFERKAIVKKI